MQERNFQWSPRKTAKVEVGEDIAEQDQSPVAQRLDQVQRIACTTDLRSEVHVRDEQGVEHCLRHAHIMTRDGYTSVNRM